MISYLEAIAILRKSAELLSEETIESRNSLGRLISRSVTSPENFPSFNNSAMDGFAYRLKDCALDTPPFTFRIQGLIAAGDPLAEKTKKGHAWEIMTGAQVPSDCDAVIRVEDTQKEKTGVRFLKPCSVGENIRFAGTDIPKDARLVSRGTRVYPEHLMAFAALGIAQLPVVRRPKVSVLSTGSELCTVVTGGGQIRNSTAPFLMAEIANLGGEGKYLGIVKDSPNEFIELLKREISDGTDVCLTTGAVSMGKYDFVATALRDLGAEILFHKVAIRPGKPLLFARLGKTAFFGVPGNPISSVVGLRFFVEPYLRSIQGLLPEKPVKARLKNSFKKPEGLRCFFKARYVDGSVEILGGQESYRMLPFLECNSWAVLAETGREAAMGSEIDVYPLHFGIQKETA